MQSGVGWKRVRVEWGGLEKGVRRVGRGGKEKGERRVGLGGKKGHG